MNGKVPKGKILVKPVEKEEKTAGGIYRPQTEKTNQQEGEVILTGIEVEPTIKGRIIFNQHAGIKVEIDGTDYLLVNEREVLYIR